MDTGSIRKRSFPLLYLIATILLLAPAPAAAYGSGFTVVHPDPEEQALMQSWVDQSLLPTPPVTVIVHPEGCGMSYACVETHKRPMEMAFPPIKQFWGAGWEHAELARQGIRMSFMHEVAHVVDFTIARNVFKNVAGPRPVLTYRKRFLKIMKLGEWAWLGPIAKGIIVPLGAASPSEWFAMGWAYCSLHRSISRQFIDEVYERLYDYYPTPRQHRQVCRVARTL